MPTRTPKTALAAINPARICLIKPSALGDVVQSLPLLPVLRERYPKAEICWVVNRELSELLEGHPHLDGILCFDRRGPLANWVRLVRELRDRRFDLVFDLQGLLRTGLMTIATRAPLRVGLETAREGAHRACHWIVPDSGPHMPAHLRYWRVAEAIGMGHARREMHVAIGDADRAWVTHQVGTLGRPILAINPGARWKTKRWPAEKFAVIAAKSTRAFGSATIILGSSNERSIAAQMHAVLRKFVPTAEVRDLSGKTTLKQLAAVLSQSDVLLTNDSGPMHLAAGLGTPVVAVFTCTNPLRSGPQGEQHELVSTKLSCAGSYRKRCPYQGRKHMACMEELATERVWQAMVRLFEKHGLRRAA